MFVGIGGQLMSGKDVLADYLVEVLNQSNIQWHRKAFASAVKDVYKDAFGVDNDFIEKWKRIPEPPPGMLLNVRKSLQFIGDGFRQIRPDIWIEIALRTDENLVISDSRYINEAKQIKARNGLNIVLYRPGFENDDPNPSESQIRTIVDWCLKTHQYGPIRHTESMVQGAEYYDYFMVNDGDIEKLHQKINEELVPWMKDIVKL